MLDSKAITVIIIILVVLIVLAVLFPNNKNIQGMQNVTSTNNIPTYPSLPSNNCDPKQKPDYYVLDDEFNFSNNVCSKSCCAPQWPTPINEPVDPNIINNMDNFVLNNLYCKGQEGCMCLTKKQAAMISG